MSVRHRLALAAVVVAASAGLGACQTDEAVERDTRDAREEVQREAEEAGRDLEEAAPGDADDDGR